MTKPVFGKWTSVEDRLPKFEAQAGGIEFVFVLALRSDGGVSKMEYNSKKGWRDCGYPVSQDYITHWMPLPKEGQDAFTELRAKLDDWEEFIHMRHPEDENSKALISEIREVIGE